MLLTAVIIYAFIVLGISFLAQRKIHDEEDFIVAGRRMPIWLNTGTLLATWFGAGTLLTTSDEIALEGVRIIALEPLGAGLCLVVTGLFFARPHLKGTSEKTKCAWPEEGTTETTENASYREKATEKGARPPNGLINCHDQFCKFRQKKKQFF